MSDQAAYFLFTFLALAGILASAVYSGLETGVYVLNRVRLKLRAAAGSHAALRVQSELAHSGRLIATMLIGTNLAIYLSSYAMAEILHRAGVEDWTAIILEIALVTPVLFVLAESLPKEAFRQHADRWVYAMWRMLPVSRALFTAIPFLPAIRVVSAVAARAARVEGAEDLSDRVRVRELIKEGMGAGVLSEHQSTLADRVFELQHRHLNQVMTSWGQVATIPLNADALQREAILRARRYTRLPVIAPDGSVVGVLPWISARMHEEASTRLLMQPALSVTVRTPMLRAIALMRQHNTTIAIVTTHDGRRPVGIVTLKDLVEPLIGEVRAW